MLRPKPRPLPLVTTIEFDDVASGTAIDTHYQAQGVTFATVANNPPGQSSAFATQSIRWRTPPNTVSVSPTSPDFDASGGGVQVTFHRPVFGVSIYAHAGWAGEFTSETDNRPFIEAFDDDGAVIAETKYPYPWWDPNFGSWENLVVTSSAGPKFVPRIKSAIFSSQRNGIPHVWAEFDTLRFWLY